MLLSLSKLSRIALATITLFAVMALPVAEARPAKQLPSFFTSRALPEASQAFQTPVGPWVPLRRSRAGNCSDQGGMVICRFFLLTVPAKKIVRIDNVSCGGPVDAGNVIQFFILTTSPDFAALEPVAVIPAKQTVDLGGGLLIIANEKGPYFFNAGERAFILGGGSLGSNSHCMISGFIAATN